MMREGKKRGRRWLSLLLCMLMILPSNFSFVVAAGAGDTGLCEHHPAHTADCGYVAAVEGQPCQHVHDDTCGYAAAVPETPCDKDCTDTDGDGIIDHAEDCAYKAAVAEQPCNHVHDESCGYVAAVAGSPCNFVCTICSPEQGDEGNPEDKENPKEDVTPVPEVTITPALDDTGFTGTEYDLLQDDSEIGERLDGDYAYISEAYLLPDSTTASGYAIRTGSAPWDKDDEAGNDSSDLNNTVRSSDIVSYTVGFKSEVREDAPYKTYKTGTLYFEFVLPGDSSEVQFETDSMGWLSAKSAEYKITEESYDGQTYQVLRGSFLWEPDDQNSVAIGGSYQELGVVTRVLAMEQDETVQPKFTFWLQGNDVPTEGLVTDSNYPCKEHAEIEYKTVATPSVTVTAAQAQNDATEIYVSSTGNDEQNTGTKDSPFATLTKAVEAASDGATIYVMSDLTMNQCARFYDKSLKITSDEGGPYTITRSDDFKQQSDTARSWYNPAMIEVQSSSASSVGLTLSNIILDDAGRRKGTVFAQAVSGSADTAYVQDAIIASNAAVPCTVTLGTGAVLRNFGGMSAVRATDQAIIVMESGSVIEDTGYTRTKGAAGSVGPAGAVWIQGGTLVMKEGSTIQNVNGRAVYADGGKVEIGGTISGIVANKNAMWQANNGIAIHLRNNAEGTLTSTALIKEISGGSMIHCADGAKSFKMENGSRIVDCSQLNGNVVYAQNSTIVIDGEISNVYATGNHILQTAGGTTVTIGENGKILNNHANYGTVYINGKDEQLDIYGKINGNICTDRGGGVVLSNNGDNHNAVMYSGAEICNNKSEQTGGGVMVSKGSFTMNGGTISGNISGTDSAQSEANRVGGGVFVRRGGQFIMNGGAIENNGATGFGGGVCFDASDYGNMVPKVELNNGTIQNNLMQTVVGDGDTVSDGVSNDLAITSKDFGKTDRYLYISSEVAIGNKAVYFQTDSKTITPDGSSLDIKLGNTSAANVTALTDASKSMGWNDPLTTFWVQRDGAAELTIGGLALNGLPVYVLTLPVDETGNVPVDSKEQVYAAQKMNTGEVKLTLPDVSGNGYAVAIVQPSQEYGTLTISGPETIEQNKGGTDYSVTYTVTYAMSESMRNIIEQSSGEAEYVLEIAQDSRLAGNPGSFNGESIEVTYSLPNSEFEAGDYLLASAKLTITVGQNSYIVPSNVAKTQMVEATYSLTTQVNGGHGTISASKTGLAAGSYETIIFTPDAGYEIDTVTVNGVKAEVLSNILEVIMDADKTVIVTYKNTTPTPDGDDLEINKTVDKTTAAPGETLIYTITGINNTSDAVTLNVIDTLPQNITIDETTISNDGYYDRAARTISWSVALSTKEAFELSFKAVIDADFAGDAIAANHVQTTFNDVVYAADSDSVKIKQSVEMDATVTVKFVGLDNDTELPAGYTLTGDKANEFLTGAIALTKDEDTDTMVYTGKITAVPGKDYALKFAQTGYNVDGYKCDSAAAVSKTVTADAKTGVVVELILDYTKINWDGLTITKTADETYATSDSYVKYTITVTNNTGIDLTNVNVFDYLPSTVRYSDSSGGYNNDTSSWTITELADGKSATATISVKLNSGLSTGTVIKNTAYVDSVTVDGAEYAFENLRLSDTAEVIVTDGKGTPKTGDESNPGLWIAVMMLSLACAGAAMVTHKKRRTGND